MKYEFAQADRLSQTHDSTFHPEPECFQPVTGAIGTVVVAPSIVALEMQPHRLWDSLTRMSSDGPIDLRRSDARVGSLGGAAQSRTRR